MYCIFLQMPGDVPRLCKHAFIGRAGADRYAKRGAEICRAITLVVRNTTVVGKFDYRPN